MSSINERLKKARQKLALSQETFAELIGVNLRTYRGYETDERRVPADLLASLSEKAGIRCEWLLLGKGALMEKNSSTPTRPPIPVVGEVQAGPDGRFMPESVLYYMPRPVGVTDEDAFAFEIRGDSMLPRYRQGDVVICSRRVSVSSDDDVVLALEWGETMCKIWRNLGETVRLESWNDAFKPLEVKASQVIDRAKVIGLVWGSLAKNARMTVEDAPAA